MDTADKKGVCLLVPKITGIQVIFHTKDRYQISFTGSSSKAHNPDGKWTRKPLAYQESNYYSSIHNMSYLSRIFANFVSKSNLCMY